MQAHSNHDPTLPYPPPLTPLAPSPFVCMQSVIEKSVVFGMATGSRQGSGSLADLVTSYASILASQVGGSFGVGGCVGVTGARVWCDAGWCVGFYNPTLVTAL